MQDLMDGGIEVEDFDPVDGAEQGVDELAGVFGFEAEIFLHAAAGVNGDDDGKGQIGVLFEGGNFLRVTVIEDGEVVLGEGGDGSTCVVCDVGRAGARIVPRLLGRVRRCRSAYAFTSQVAGKGYPLHLAKYIYIYQRKGTRGGTAGLYHSPNRL